VSESADRTGAEDWEDIQVELMSASREACGGGFTWPSEEIRTAFANVEAGPTPSAARGSIRPVGHRSPNRLI